MTDNYQKALEDAQKELNEVETEIARKQQRKAQLDQTIIGLKSLMGDSSGVDEHSLSELIRMILRGSKNFLSAQDVNESLGMFGTSKFGSVNTILNRMAKDSEIVTGKTADGKVGYMWNRTKLRPVPPPPLFSAKAKKK